MTPGNNNNLFLFLVMSLVLMLATYGCAAESGDTGTKQQTSGQVSDGNAALIQTDGKTVAERFLVPEGYRRIEAEKHSFAAYLRNLSLKPHGSKVLYYNGESKNRDVYEAVVDLEIGTKDLQQCADAVIRLRAEYLWQEQKYDSIRFNFTNGFTAAYAKWREGYRVKVEGNSASWVKSAGYSDSYQDFRKYLDLVFAYAGTLSLSKELEAVPVEDMQIGYIFIQGGSPGHCVIVVDMAQHEETGEKLFMLAQSYMPAQDIQILKNPNDSRLSPWYSGDFGGILKTPEWVFGKDDLKRFRDY